MSKYRYFTDQELGCRCSICKDKPSSDNMNEDFMQIIVALREELGFSLPATSAYRCKDHPDEVKKEKPGSHNTGSAIDIQVSGVRAFKLIKAALDVGILGLGVNQKGDPTKRFIHLDMDFNSPNRPAVWSY
jgi:zinc D-Ala-D-Ala carboxypeptidase